MRRLFIAVGFAVSLAVVGIAGPSTAAPPRLALRGNGLSVVHLRADQSSTMAILTRLLGRPSTRLTSTPDLVNCGVNATSAWHSLAVYFDNHRLVGLSDGPERIPVVIAIGGLRVGDTLKVARAIYGAKLTTSTAQGDTWFAATPTGRIDGFLSPGTARAPLPSAHIETIDVGVVGCPAMSP